MTYTKPEIRGLGDATNVIQDLSKYPFGYFETADQWNLQPAYDLDE